MKFYNHYVTTYRNGVEIMSKMHNTILTNDIPENKTDELTWDNLNDYYREHGLELPFGIWHFKKGRVILFHDGSLFDKYTRDIIEWKKKKPLNITIKHEYKETNVSIDYVLKWYDADKAIQYLNERGLKIS